MPGQPPPGNTLESESPHGKLRVRVSGYGHARDRTGRKYVCYVVKVRHADVSWVIWRRYAAFKLLNEQLNKELPAALLERYGEQFVVEKGLSSSRVPPCPRTTGLGGGAPMSPAALDERRKALQGWLASLVRSNNGKGIFLSMSSLFAFCTNSMDVPPTGFTLLAEVDEVGFDVGFGC